MRISKSFFAASAFLGCVCVAAEAGNLTTLRSPGVWAWECDHTNNLDECYQQVQQERPHSLRGAFMNIYWRDLEVADGKFDWSGFDSNLTKAAQNGLQVQPLVYIYDCAHPLPRFVSKIRNATIEVYRNGGSSGPICHAPAYLNPAFQDRWHRVVKALATHLAG